MERLVETQAMLSYGYEPEIFSAFIRDASLSYIYRSIKNNGRKKQS